MIYIRREPSDPTGPANLGLLRIAQTRYAEAIPELRRALAMNPAFPGLGLDLAKALRHRATEMRREGLTVEAETLAAEADDLEGHAAKQAGRRNQRSGMITTAR